MGLQTKSATSMQSYGLDAAEGGASYRPQQECTHGRFFSLFRTAFTRRLQHQ